MKINIDLHDWAVQDIKRLIAEATADPDGGGMVAVRDDTFPQWIGAARAHLAMILEKAEKSQS